ncbi:HNH endonuclease [Fredinandcohnia sp. 179-A 10B2 NHS]
MAEFVKGIEDKVYRILLIARVMGIREYPGFEDLHFNRLGSIALRKQLSVEEIDVLFELLEKTYNPNLIKNELIRQIIEMVKEKHITTLKGYEDINFSKISVAKYALRGLLEHELVFLYNQLSYDELPVKRMTPSPIKEILKTTVPQKESITIPPLNNEKIEIDTIIEDILDHVKKLSLEVVEGITFTNVEMAKSELAKLNQEQLEALLVKLEDLYDQHTEFTEMVDSILKYAEEKNVIDVEGFEWIDFYNREIAKEELNECTFKQLQDLLLKIENMDSIEVDDSVEGRILQLVKAMDLFSLPGYEKLNFRKLTRKQLNEMSELELSTLVTRLEELYLVDFLEEETDVINPLEVINRYRDGAVQEEVEEKSKEELWRKYVPTLLKQKIPNWKTERIELFYERAKEVMEVVRGTSSYQEVYEFVIDLSQVVFEEKREEKSDSEGEEFIFNDSVEESIMSLVEMIILPHVEVLDRIENKNGKIMFSNLWNVDFTEKLKNEVLDRDHWRCVVCEAETHLHVHHKIPRRLGGVHHKDNLVTLCASCHSAVETADVKKAFQKCLANFKKNKFRSNRNLLEELSKDKSLLKQEVEQTLDKILVTLNNKGEEELMGEIIEVMNRLEVIFYE